MDNSAIAWIAAVSAVIASLISSGAAIFIGRNSDRTRSLETRQRVALMSLLAFHDLEDAYTQEIANETQTTAEAVKQKFRKALSDMDKLTPKDGGRQRIQGELENLPNST
jgi:hypothetical protein